MATIVSESKTNGYTITIHLEGIQTNGSKGDLPVTNGLLKTDTTKDRQSTNGYTKDDLYSPVNNPPPTRLATKCHPLADEICAELDGFFAQHWPWENEHARQKFLAADVNRWACWALPLARNDRILDAVKVNTLLFLLDDVAENMSVEEGKALYKRLIPIAKGKVLPNRADPYEWITYDVWASMRAVDEGLTENTFQGALLCVNAQVDAARNSCVSMSSLLKQRYKEGGVGFVAAAMCYAMDLHISPSAMLSISDISESYSRLGIIVNDIYSYAKELRAWNRHRKEGAQILNMVLLQMQETGVTLEASKRLLWVLCREWELQHFELVAARQAAVEGCEDVLRVYMEGLEYVLGGNEKWSSYTQRYHERD
ncbi:hypothetical protein MMC13_008143 [Lambiella insularis]|nr:hypothetical protein [Lambiella insularis]